MQDYETLYNSLDYNVSLDDLNDDEKEELSSLVENFDIEQREIFYQLILHHWSRINPNTKVIYPYKMKQIDNDLEVKVDCLPIRVKRILLKFGRLAKKSGEEKEGNEGQETTP
jgi:hypothetical protein